MNHKFTIWDKLRNYLANTEKTVPQFSCCFSPVIYSSRRMRTQTANCQCVYSQKMRC